MPDSQSPASPPNRQFQLRHAALAFVVISVPLAIAAPLLRDLNATQWTALVRFVGSGIVGGVVAFLFGARFDPNLIQAVEAPRRRFGAWSLLQFVYLLAMFAALAYIGTMRVVLAGEEPRTESVVWFANAFLLPAIITYHVTYQAIIIYRKMTLASV
ncbi:hypothetical protein [Blastopirellula marina]|uniref:Uncharacterized protein n=1 Tax=Blastopirellula marina TaxID=124 RepID=A0A2S8GFB1_9BACT|nr:hypothetical protein [Blastopirellula marina]PQO43147.1 hypothetical protein C5Y93_25925 [Blastopirellula marina]